MAHFLLPIFLTNIIRVYCYIMDTIEKTSVIVDSPVQVRIPVSPGLAIDKLRSTEQMKTICLNLYRKGFLNGSFSDVTVSVLGMDYKLHRLILSQNPYFASMLEQTWKESVQPRVQLKIDDPHISVESMTMLFSR
jgi:hypothetical protein